MYHTCISLSLYIYICTMYMISKLMLQNPHSVCWLISFFPDVHFFGPTAMVDANCNPSNWCFRCKAHCGCPLGEAGNSFAQIDLHFALSGLTPPVCINLIWWSMIASLTNLSKCSHDNCVTAQTFHSIPLQFLRIALLNFVYDFTSLKRTEEVLIRIRFPAQATTWRSKVLSGGYSYIPIMWTEKWEVEIRTKVRQLNLKLMFCLVLPGLCCREQWFPLYFCSIFTRLPFSGSTM